MRKSIFFYKELTPAEVGKTGTHEVYVRLPNNFDYESFFGGSAVQNGSVMEVNFTAQDITNGGEKSTPLRFVYFKNSNQEKRIPSLGPLFKSHNVQEGDIVCLESRIDGTSHSYYLCFYKKGEIQVNPAAVYFSKIEKDPTNASHNSNIEQSLQQIFYGAPGTGKSHAIKNQTNCKSVIRTTFHPDSDYSTFVGAYKPTMKSSERVYTPEELTIKLKEIKTTGTTYPCHKFAAKYWESIKDLSPDSIKQILNACGFTDNYSVEVGKGIAIGQEYLNKPEDGRIIYTFCPQAFTNAYVKAWNADEDVYLIIEEINRGNCAQIFGDLFQLLDRKNGVSEYPVEADTDLQNYLQKALADTTRTDIPDEVKSGKKLMLPSNLYIWATMNTSDQSLFPIDSAFKRRWDWVYIPIADAKKNYVIEIDNDQYDWWSFLEAINDIIESTTHSEDKKLGYFFAKAKDGRISVETFVSKVIFYLWNDVFKDNETNHKAFKDNNGELLAFRKFFHSDGTVDTNVVIKFLQDLEVYPFETSEDGTMVTDTTPNTKRLRDKSRYVVNGKDGLNKAQMTREAFRLYIEAHSDADAQTIAQAWNGLGLKDYVQHLVETEAEFNARTKDSTDTNKRATEFELSNGEKIYLSTQFGIGNIDKFIDAINNAGWNIRIENQD